MDEWIEWRLDLKTVYGPLKDDEDGLKNKWIDGWMDALVDDTVVDDKAMEEWKDGRMYWWTDVKMDWLMDELIEQRINRWILWLVERLWKEGYMNKLRDEWIK